MFTSRDSKIIKTKLLVAILLVGSTISSVMAATSEEAKVSTTPSDSISSSIENTQTKTESKAERNQEDKDKTTPTNESKDTKSATTESIAAESGDNEEKHLFMWKATRGNQSIYLLGTIHVVRAGFYPVPDEIDKAFEQSRELFVECIPDREKILNVSKSLKNKYAYKSGDNLSKHLNPQTKRVFEEYLTWAGEPMEIYESFRPFEVSGLISSDAVRRYGLTVPGLDRYLINKAKQANKKVVELESVEFQLNLLSGLSEPEQNAELLSSLLTLQDVAVNLDRIIHAWREGDADDLEQFVTKVASSDSELRAVYDKIIDARNQGMVRRLEDCLKDDGGGTYLVAVGSAHLVGSYGLPALLKAKGFSVSQVPAPKEQPKTSFGSSKLEKLYYPEGRFSVLLPGPPSVRYGYLGGMRIVEYIYPTFAGAYTVGYIILPKGISDPVKLNSFYNFVGMGMVSSLTERFSKTPAAGKTSATGKSRAISPIKLGAVVQNSVGMCNHMGRQLQVEISDPHGEKGLIRVRLVVVDQYLYLVSVAGKQAWVNSPIVNEVLNSLNVRSPSNSYQETDIHADTQIAAVSNLATQLSRKHDYLMSLRLCIFCLCLHFSCFF